jgi:hypothetical protein
VKNSPEFSPIFSGVGDPGAFHDFPALWKAFYFPQLQDTCNRFGEIFETLSKHMKTCDLESRN